MSIRLPPKGYLARTGPVDVIDDYFSFGFGTVMRRRLEWVRQALPTPPLRRILDIGYGSGIFQFTLAAMAGCSVGVDVHEMGGAVRRKLHAAGVGSALVRADGDVLPFADRAFDAVVIVSTLEFVSDPAACLREALRVCVPGGRVVCLRPRALRWADAIFRRLAGVDPERDFAGGRERVERALEDVRAAVERRPRPAFLPAALAPYEVVTLEPAPRAAGLRGIA